MFGPDGLRSRNPLMHANFSAMADIHVTRTYLEMTDPAELRRTPLEPGLRFEKVLLCPVPFFRFLSREVGRHNRWTDRLRWTDEQCRAHLDQPGVELWVLYSAGAPAGYAELARHDDASVEIAYFGLLPDFIGHGLGKQLLTATVERAWALGARRVWLHTCTLDSPAALPNYRGRGFRSFKTEHYTVPELPVENASAAE